MKRKTCLLLLLVLACTRPVLCQPAYQWAFNIGNVYSGTSANAMALDGSGNCITTGTFSSNNNPVDFDPGPGVINLNGTVSMFIARYDAAPGCTWAFLVSSNNGGPVSTGIATDAADNIYVTGYMVGTADFDPGTGTAALSASNDNIFVAKYDSSGNYQWAFRIGGSLQCQAFDISVDASGNSYVTGYFQGSNIDFDPGTGTAPLTAPDKDIFVAKYDANGNYVWAFRLGAGSMDEGHGIAVDNAGSVFITGYYQATVDFDPGTGTFNLTNPNTFYHQVYVAKYTSAGNFIWAFKLGGGSTDDEGNDLATDPSGNVYVTGFVAGPTTVDFDPGTGTANLAGYGGASDAFVAKYTSAGNYQWASRVGGTGTDEGFSISVDPYGNCFAAGEFDSPTIDLDPGTGTNLVSNVGNEDVFTVFYSSSGSYVWGFGIGSSMSDNGAVGTGNPGDFFVAGSFGGGTVDFDPGISTANLTSVGNFLNMYVAKYNDLTVSSNDTEIHGLHVEIYPNPTQGIVHLNSSEEINSVKVINVLGETVLCSSHMNARSVQLLIDNEVKGVCFLIIETGQATLTKKILIH